MDGGNKNTKALQQVKLLKLCSIMCISTLFLTRTNVSQQDEHTCHPNQKIFSIESLGFISISYWFPIAFVRGILFPLTVIIFPITVSGKMGYLFYWFPLETITGKYIILSSDSQWQIIYYYLEQLLNIHIFSILRIIYFVWVEVEITNYRN